MQKSASSLFCVVAYPIIGTFVVSLCIFALAYGCRVESSTQATLRTAAAKAPEPTFTTYILTECKMVPVTKKPDIYGGVDEMQQCVDVIKTYDHNYIVVRNAYGMAMAEIK